jgi:hypothetical protein
MPLISNSKHELFAQNVSKGLSLTAAYIKAGFSKSGAAQNAHRLTRNEQILARINELKTAIADQVVSAEIRRRSWRVQQLQEWADEMLYIRAARKLMYADQKGEGYEFQVQDLAEEQAAIADGCHERINPYLPPPPPADWKGPPPPRPPVYPKTMVHPGYPNGAASGLLLRDFRGRNAEQEIWKFDAPLVAQFRDALKQAAIEEGQWAEKRDQSGTVDICVIEARINAGRDRLAVLKKERDAKLAAAGPPTPEKRG